jgi:hypothetical protein
VSRRGADPDVSPWQGAAELNPKALMSDMRSPVGVTPDLRRIAALPVRPPPDLTGVEGAALVAWAKARWGLKRAPGSCVCTLPAPKGLGRPACIDTPFPIQAWTLFEIALAGGLVGPITVGGGKTFVDILAALAMPDCKIAVLLVPPGLRPQLKREYYALEQHFKVPSFVFGPGEHEIKAGAPVVHVIPYSLFSRPESTDILERIGPDTIISDEAHKLRHYDTATVGRVLRYFQRHPSTRLCAWSGTLIAKSLKDCAHLFALALRAGSPLPVDPAVVEEWALAVDPGGFPSPAGALERFGLPVRQGLNRRITSTAGVVASTGASISAPLRILERTPPAMPALVVSAMSELESRNVRPDGEQLVEDTEIARCAQELSCGFFYRWRFPHGEPEPLILEWFAKRKAWAAELRDKLGDRREHLDSPRLCQDAAERYHGDMPATKTLPEWASLTWPEWRDIRHKVKPEPGNAVWIDDWLARDAAEWTKTHHGIVWYKFREFGEAVARLSGRRRFGGGPRGGGLIDANGTPIAEFCRDPIVLSVNAHGTGRDGLQYHYSDQLFAAAMSSGQLVEQALGRLHRTGQRAAEITAWRYRHTTQFREAWEHASERSALIDELLHPGQKLVAAGG